jgi:hypothetical protein
MSKKHKRNGRSDGQDTFDFESTVLLEVATEQKVPEWIQHSVDLFCDWNAWQDYTDVDGQQITFSIEQIRNEMNTLVSEIDIAYNNGEISEEYYKSLRLRINRAYQQITARFYPGGEA